METQLHTTTLSFYHKLKILFLLISLTALNPAKALINGYAFNPSTQTIDPMTTGVTQLIAAGQDDIASAVTAIGFNFVFNGTTYTNFSVSSNGLMRLGSTVVSATDGNASNANVLASTTISDFPRIAPYWDNLRTTTTTGSVRYRVSGTAPNRILIVDWICTVITSGSAVKFQVWLSETSNSLEFVYGACGSNTTSYSVGLCSSTSANDVSYVTVASTFASSTQSNSVVNNANSNTIATATPNNSFKYSLIPGCAGSLTPAASATGITPTPTLTWAASATPFTKGYDVYFGTAASPPRVVYNQAGTSYAPGTLNNGTVYFWKINARNDSAVAASCSTIQFTTAVAPGCATTYTPVNAATNVSATPTLSWSGATGTITGYDVYLSSNNTLVTNSDPSVRVSTNQAGTSFVPGTLIVGTVYFWKVVPINNGARPTSCTVNQFTTVVAPGCATSLVPAVSATGISPTATLTWAVGSGTTTGYDVYFGTAVSPSIVSTNQAGTSYNPGTLLNGTTYNWKVQPRNGAAIASCAFQSFTTAVAPGCSGSPSPAASATNVATNPTLSWSAGSGTITGYDVFFGTNASPPQVTTNQAGLTYTPPALNINTVYFWKVVPQNNGALASGCATIQFTTIAPPGCTTTPFPAASATGVVPAPTLTWVAGSGTTTGYDVYFGTAGSPPLVSSNQAGTSYSPGTLTAGTVYFWKVNPRNGAAVGSCSTIQFTVATTPGCPGSLSPSAAASNVSTTATLSWAANGTTTGYDVYFGTAASPPLVSSNQAGLGYNPGTLNISTTYFWKLVPQNNGVFNNGCTTNQFTTVIPPGCTTTPSPAASASNVSPSATLSWVVGSGTTTGYDVYFGTAASPPIVSTNQAGTTYNPGGMLAGTTYFWKIVPRNGAALNTGCVTNQFTIAVAPGCATNFSPAASATNIATSPTLSWSAGSGTTTGYDVYFGTAANPPLVVTNQAGTTYSPPALAIGTVYNWKIVPLNNGAQATGCSINQFTTIAAPGCSTSPSPAASATNVSTTPTLSWSAGSGITTGYDVYFGTIASPPIVSTNQAGTTYTPSTLNGNTVYFWKVQPRNNNAIATCSVIQFTTAVPPGCPGSMVPANAATNQSLSLNLTWAAGSGTTTGYDVYFGTIASPPLVSTNQPGTSYTPSLLPGTQYFWKVIPRNNGASPASCSTISFTTIAAPGCPGNLTPANGTINLATSTTISWTAGSGTTNGYDVYFGTNSNPPQVTTNQAGTSYNPGTLAIATDYYWKVVPRNNGGAFNSGCTINQFTTLAPPGCVQNGMPDDMDVDILTNETLSWDPGTGVSTGYDVYFGTNSNPPLVSTNQAGTTYNQGTMLIDRTYYWKVIPRNNALINNSCPVTQFQTISPPGCISSSNPVAGATEVGLTPVLSWAPDGGTTTGYDVYFGTAANPPAVSINQVETTYTTPTLNSNTVYYWKIVPRNDIALAINCPVYQFTTVVPPGCVINLSPAASSTNVSITPTLTWTAGSGNTSGYDVYFGTATSPPLVSTNQQNNNYIPSTLNVNTVYRWKIVPQNLGALTSGCPTIQFTTVAAPGCATSLAPAASATNVNPNIVLSWAAGSGSTTGYDVYFGTNASPPLVSSNQAGTTYTPPSILNAGTVYFWKINPINNPAVASCSTIQFTTAVAPGCTTTPSPAASATGIPTTALLSWVAGSGTTNGYDVYFGTSASPPKVSSNQPGTTYNPGTLNASSVYFWKILPLNNGSANNSCSTIQFTTATGTSCANSISPPSGSTNLPLQNTLSWSPGPGNAPTGYDIYFGTATNPPLVVSNQAATNYVTTNLNFSTTYYWRAVPRTGGTPATACPVNQFTTSATLKYDVTRSTGVSYNSIALTGSTVAQALWRNGTNTDDNLSNPINIGFSFPYNGNTYSQFVISLNGFISLNNNINPIYLGNDSIPYGWDNAALSHGRTNPTPSSLMIAPCYDDFVCQGNPGDMNGLNTAIRYRTTGTVGSRVLTVEWAGLETYGQEGPNINFQVKLFETSGNIDFVYGSMETFNGTGSISYSNSIGMTGIAVSTIPRKGEIINQITADTRNFDSTVAVQMIQLPSCNTMLHFTPGNYTPYVPPGSLVPANDNPAGAFHLDVNPSPCSNLCGTYYSSANATATPGIQLCGVGASTPDDDVWFEFFAVNANTTIKVAGGTSYDAVLQLFDNSFNSLACANSTTSPPGLTGFSETITMSTLNPGDHYYIRVYHKGSNWGGSSSAGQFSICVSAVPVVPSNNECANRIILPADGSFIVGSSTVAATGSTGIPACSVAGTNPDDDVWYSFTCLQSIEVITVVGNSGFNAVIQLFSGTCGALTPIACMNNFGNAQTEVLTASGLTVGATYYVRVYHSNVGGGSGSYSINFASPPPPCETLMLPPDGSTDMLTEGFDLVWDLVIGADNYKVLLDTVNPPVRLLTQTTTTDTTINTGQLLASKTYYWKVIPGNGTSYTNSCPISSFVTESRPILLNVRVFLEGLYIGSNLMKSLSVPADTLTDTVTVSLFDTQADNELYSETTMLSVNGWVTGHFPTQTLESDYYIVIMHKNHLETWSQLFTFNNSGDVYNFTTSNTQAYHDYQKLVSPGVYAIYFGDFNQDDFIDWQDLQFVGEQAALFATGTNLREDLNNDGYVESTDYSIFENRAAMLLSKQWPWMP